MNTKEISILSLTYNIRFHDADEGDCYAGEGCHLISVHQDRASADAIVSEFNPVFSEAEKEHTVFPVQKFNSMLKKRFGFDLHDIDNGYDFKLSVKTYLTT